MTSVNIKLEPEFLFLQIISLLKSGEKNLVNALESSIALQLKAEFSSIFESVLKKDVEVKIHEFYFKNRSASVSDLNRKGYQTWYTTIKLCCKSESNQIDEIEVNPIGFELKPISYGFGVKRSIKLKKKILKTQVNYFIEFLNIKILPQFFMGLDISSFEEGNELILCNLNEEPQVNGLEVVSFTNAQNGGKYFCSCAAKYHGHIISHCNAIKAQYVAGAWPHRLKALIENAKYQEGVCHLCIAQSNGVDEAKMKYGDGILFNQRPYVCQTVFDFGLNRTTALADVRMRLGISKWKNEALLYSIIKSLFIGCRVEREYSPSWLNRQRIDIFLPEKNLAIEYQGEQHFTPISIFGGESAFEKGQERDRIKLEKCNENNVNLVYFNFNEPLTQDYIRRKLQKYIQPK